MMTQQFATILLTVALAGGAAAGPQTFDFKDPKGVNNAIFKLDAPLEAISGSASGIAGTIRFDPQHPEATRGRIVVSSSSLHVPNPIMKGHLHGPKWLDVSRYKEITFEAKSLQNIKTVGANVTADAVGVFTLKGIAKKMTIPVKLTYLKDKLQARVPNLKGDLLVVRASFTIKRSDFNIMPGEHEEKVSDTIELSLSIAGAAPR